MSPDQVRDMFIFVAETVIANEDYLTQIDRKIGDGDHGIGMSVGFNAVKRELTGKAFKNVNDVFRCVGMTLLDTMGGASGVLFGTVFISGIIGYKEITDMKLEDFDALFGKSLEALKTRGKAKVGDKTMVDALEPAVCSFSKSVKNGLSIVEGLELAALEARRGMEYTKECVARFGRAKSYGEKAIGLQDAGATSVSIIFDAMFQWAKSNL